MLKKRTFIILIFIVCFISLIYFTNKTISEDNKISSDIGVLIYSKWNSYIFAKSGEKIVIQVPIYDFNSELESSHIQVNNFNIGTVEEIKLVNKQIFAGFNQYMLEFVLIPDTEGLHKINNLVVKIDTIKNVYTEVLGEWVFEIIENNTKNGHITITGGTLLEQYTDNFNSDFDYYTELLNSSNQKITLKGIEVNYDKIIMTNNSLIKRELQPNEEVQLTELVNISNTLGNSVIRPKLIYSIDNSDYVLPLNQAIFASSVPTSELNKILKEKHENKTSLSINND